MTRHSAGNPAPEVAEQSGQGGNGPARPTRVAPDGPPEAPLAPDAPAAAAAAATAQSAVPPGGFSCTVREDDDGKNTQFTCEQVPAELMPLAHMAQETALGLMGLLAAIFILGPFARMFARRMERRPEVQASSDREMVLQQQLGQLQQSIDAMSIEMERISESQRFQSKLLYERAPEKSSLT